MRNVLEIQEAGNERDKRQRLNHSRDRILCYSTDCLGCDCDMGVRLTMGMTIEIIDNTTGRPPSEKLIDRIAKEYGLMKMDIDQFAVCEDGQIILLDDCGNVAYCDMSRFEVKEIDNE